MNITTDLPNQLDALLKAILTEYLSEYRARINQHYDKSHDLFLSQFMPIWNTILRAHEEVEKHYYGSVGNRAVFNASEMITNMASMLVPVSMRPQRFLNELPQEAQDQIARQFAYCNLSTLTGIPLPLLLPVDFDEEGDVSEIFDLIVEGPSGKPLLTQWASPIMMSLQDEGIELPEELEQLIRLPNSFA